MNITPAEMVALCARQHSDEKEKIIKKSFSELPTEETCEFYLDLPSTWYMGLRVTASLITASVENDGFEACHYQMIDSLSSSGDAPKLYHLYSVIPDGTMRDEACAALEKKWLSNPNCIQTAVYKNHILDHSSPRFLYENRKILTKCWPPEKRGVFYSKICEQYPSAADELMMSHIQAYPYFLLSSGVDVTEQHCRQVLGKLRANYDTHSHLPALLEVVRKLGFLDLLQEF